ncbi:methyl-accepting chemotaxis protein [Halalkalibacillus sediminis]|uniref:Methyl-accepting chemotaxis protein n=1 Tax=Halalkalibacillus sediminis TaxID=2018042 RepID=A0A2I0QV74_9BACI|nr:HAMP domain-containing methyl-accepting chemotaxis protein [Halalkalibacillus sediminis]PKR78247.1 methyl-accepting chemotaxis protein [Halalkalibacillus sediminis]
MAWSFKKKRSKKVEKDITKKGSKKKRAFLSNVTLGKKYGIILITTILLFLLASGAVYFFINQANSAVDEQDRRSERAVAIEEMRSLFRGKDVRISDYVNFKTPQYITEYEEMNSRFISLGNEIQVGLSGQQKELMSQILTKNEEVTTVFNEEIIPNVQERNNSEVMGGRTKVSMLRSETTELLAQLRDGVMTSYGEAYDTTKASFVLIVSVLLAGAVIASIVAFLLLWVVNRKVRHNLREVVHVADEISKGQLNVPSLGYHGKDEIGQLALSVNTMKDNLTSIIYEVQQASDHVSSQSEELTQSSNEVQEGSEQIASTMEELSSGSENQAQSAAKLSEMMEQLMTKVERSYENGQNVSNASDEVLNLAEDGRAQMVESVGQMRNIHQIVEEAVQKVKSLDRQSTEISKLVTVIQDVAEQTNLLALNAAIEAARAGEHGKGFAVVADEVRKLAEKVSDSVGEITSIVSEIQSESKGVTQSLESGYSEVEQGSKQIENTQQTFEKINDSINQVVGKIQEISAHLKEVSDDSIDMNRSVEEIAAVSEQSAAGVEQTAASVEQANSSMDEISRAAEDLAKLAEGLNVQVRKFNL